MYNVEEEKIEEMKRYLFGEMTEAEAEAFEQNVFEDSSRFYDLKELENTLFDDYVRGKLAEKDLQRFEKNLAKSRAAQEKLLNAKVLRNFIAAENKSVKNETFAAVKTVSDEQTFWEKISKTFGFSNSILAPAMAGLLIFFAILSGYFFFKNQQLSEEVARLKNDREAEISQKEANLAKQIEEISQRENEFKQKLETEQGQSETLTAQLEKEQSEKDKLKRQLETLQNQRENQREKIPVAPRIEQPNPTIAKVDYASLLPTLVRGGSEEDKLKNAKVITVNPQAERVVFNLKLPPNASEKSFNVSLDGQQISAASKPRNNTVRVVLDTKKLGETVHTLSVGQTDYIFRLKFN